jgi:hypothetical protein
MAMSDMSCVGQSSSEVGIKAGLEETSAIA